MSEDDVARHPPLTEDEMRDPLMSKAAREWLAARRVISTWLQELRPDLPPSRVEVHAVRLIARLTEHTPALWIMFAETPPAPPQAGEGGG